MTNTVDPQSFILVILIKLFWLLQYLQILIIIVFVFLTAPSSSLYSLSLPSTPSAMSPVSGAAEASGEKPPPLPQKQAYADYTNLTEDMQFTGAPLRKSSLTVSLRTKNKVILLV